MTSWFISVEASVISGGLLYSKGIRFLFPVGKRLVLAARRPYIERGSGSNPCRGNKKAAGIRQSLFYSMVGRQGFGPAALANARAFPQLRALSGSNPCTGNKKATNRSRSLSFLWWVVRGSACSAGGRCGAFAPCALRWQTLTRLLSSAPRRVRTRVAATKKRPTEVDRFLFYGGPSGVRTLDLGIKSPLLCQLS